MAIRWPLSLLILALAAAPRAAPAAFVAEQVTAANAGLRLFGGTDADGGIGDWYVSNGVVEAIIDEVGPPSDLGALLGAAAPPKQSEAGFTGGTLIDLGLVGMDNDQLGQMFTVGGLSTANFILYDSLAAAVGPDYATITATGRQLGFAPGVPPSNLPVVTEYTAAGTDPFLTITTTVTNTHPTNTAPAFGGFLDAIIWTQRAIVPFSPLPQRGFRHALLDLANPAIALEFPPFAAGPGSVTPADGVVDPPSGKPCGEVSYGLLGMMVSRDPDGPGGTPPTVVSVDTLFGVSSNLATALGNVPLLPGGLPPGGVLTYTRRLHVGGRDDVASVANDMIGTLGARLGFDTGTITGDVDAADTPQVAASVVVTKTSEICTQGTVGAACAADAACDTAPGSGDGACSAAPGFGANVPVTHFRTDAAGAFGGITLPVGIYDLEVRAAERDPVVAAGIAVLPGADTAVSVPPLTGLGAVQLAVRERIGGRNRPIPAKVTFIGIDGTPNPAFRKDLVATTFTASGPDTDIAAETFAGGPAQRNFVYVAGASETVRLRPGRYRLLASRGPEYTLRRREVTVRAGRTRTRRFGLRRVVDTLGFLCADFHIHSARSFDASAPLRDRVASYAGEGVEVMVSTDHDYHVDYGPIIAGLGLAARITSIVGNEVTTSVPNPPAFPSAIGHINAWPLSVDPEARRDGSIEDEYVAPNFIFTRLRGQGAEVVQYNHPRAGLAGLTSIGFFNNIGCNRCANAIDTLCTVDADCPASPAPRDCTCVGYQPDRSITDAPNDVLLDTDVTGPGTSGVPNPDGSRNIDFDAMEIGNGLDLPAYLQVRRDWLSLLNQTDFATVPFIAGTAVSDSHRLVLEEAGYFRTYVGGAGDDPAGVDVSAMNANVRAGNMVGTTGPFVEFAVEDSTGQRAGLGGTLVPADSVVTLRIRVQATNWIPVEEVRVIANGFVVPALVFDETTSPAVRAGPTSRPFSQRKRQVVRFQAAVLVDLAAAGDTYFIVEAGARLDPLPSSPDPVAVVVPGMIPVAFTNPIFVDLAGDGFDPPGLPVMAANAEAGGALPRFARVRRADAPAIGGWIARRWDGVRELLAVSRSAAADEAAPAPAGTAGSTPEPPGGERREAAPPAERREGYFPLYEFAIPERAVDEALRELSEPERARILRQRTRPVEPRTPRH